MFEGFLANFLTRALSKYVKKSGFSQERVHVALWSGFVVLKNVELREEIFDSLELPVDDETLCQRRYDRRGL